MSWSQDVAGTVKLALPVIFVQFGVMALGVVDAMVLGHLSKDALATGILAHATASAVLFAFGGILFALDPLVSQARGAQDRDGLAAHVERGLLLALALSLPATAILLFPEPLFRLLGQDPRISPVAADYLEIICWSNPAFLVFFALRQCLQAVGRTRPVVVAIIAGNAANLVLDVGLVFGRFGLPELGIEGSALATSISRWLILLAGLFWAGRHAPSRRRAPAGTRHLWPRYLQLLRIGLPIALMSSLELWVFAAVTVLMGAAGPVELAGHGVAINLASLAFMLPLGVGMAAAARVGQAIGRRDPPGARRAAAVPLVGGTALQIVSAGLFLLLPRQLAGLYTEDPAVLDVAVLLLPIAGVFQLFDGLQVIAAGVLRGAADTRIPALIALLGYWIIGLPLGIGLYRGGITGVEGYWWGLCAGLGVVSGLLLFRIRGVFRGRLEAL